MNPNRVALAVALVIVGMLAAVIFSIGKVNNIAQENRDLNRQTVDMVDGFTAAVVFVRSCENEGNTTEDALTACVEAKLDRPKEEP